MNDKQILELSDSALERVAGGVGTMSVNNTYSPTGPITAGPSAGPAGGGLCVDGKTKKDEFVDENIWALLVAAGTSELYSADCAEYTRKYNAWDDRKRMLGPTGVCVGPPPKRPNPYDYL